MPAKVLLFDIETAPLEGYAWSAYEANIIRIKTPMSLLSFAWKWLGDTGVEVKGLPDYPGYVKGNLDDTRLTADLWNVMDEADIIVAQNGDAYDIKFANTRFLSHHLTPPSTYKTFDTLKALRKTFRFSSNKLNDVATQLGVGRKLPHTGMDLWFKCMAGDEEAWEVMKRYNAQDVLLLEELYYLVRAWGNHPDVNLYDDKPKADRPPCPTCGGVHTERRGKATAKTRKYQRWHCLADGCGKWWQGDLIKESK